MGLFATVVAVLRSPRMLWSGLCLLESRMLIAFVLRAVAIVGAVYMLVSYQWIAATAMLLSCGLLSHILCSFWRHSLNGCTSSCLTGRVAIVTGGNAGIGAHVANGLAARGATVIIACRNRIAGQAIVDSINRDYCASPASKEAAGSCRAVCMHLDLEDPPSICAFVAEFTSKYSVCDVLVNNAGVMFPPFKCTVLVRACSCAPVLFALCQSRCCLRRAGSSSLL
jgi:hypothetical protein